MHRRTPKSAKLELSPAAKPPKKSCQNKSGRRLNRPFDDLDITWHSDAAWLNGKGERKSAMPTQDYWADSPFERNSTLFALYFPTLDSLIAPDDPVRLFADVLDEVDWSLWEAEYPRRKGQLPIHPRHIAAATLYGMYRGIRSSRKPEEACNYRFDFVWLVEGRHIDHTTFNSFRTKFSQPQVRHNCPTNWPRLNRGGSGSKRRWPKPVRPTKLAGSKASTPNRSRRKSPLPTLIPA